MRETCYSTAQCNATPVSSITHERIKDKWMEMIHRTSRQCQRQLSTRSPTLDDLEEVLAHAVGAALDHITLKRKVSLA